MTNPAVDEARPTREELDQLVARSETGARQPGGLPATMLFVLALSWSLYQLYVASPLPFTTGILLINDQQDRAIHLAFAMFLAFCAYPATQNSPRDRIPAVDWLLALAGAGCCLYIIVFYRDMVSHTGGIRTTPEIIASVGGMLCLMEITRRALGIPLVIVASVFAIYALLGPHMPDVISHHGVSLNRFVDHMWLTTEGVFGIALGVSTAFIFLFVLFGSMLQMAGAGNYFIQLSFALLGHLRGGPAKAAVVSSGMTGLISGSAIANIVTTGTFTIPLMKRVGFPAEKAAAIETSASINGQIMPPVMGAAAFLMTEFIGISYFEVIKHAFLPAAISYIALYYIVHLEAEKAGMPVLERRAEKPLAIKLRNMLASVGTFLALAAATYFGISLVQTLAGEGTFWAISAIFMVAYLALLYVASRSPDLELDDPDSPLIHVPEALPVLLTGLYYLLPVVVLIWCLVVERFSPGLSVLNAIIGMTVILLTQRPLLCVMRGDGDIVAASRAGFYDFILGLVTGARNMVGVAIALASAGIIVGVVSLTGLGLLMTAIIETISGGSLIVMLAVTAAMCVILGMGLPTTANYIVVISIMGHTVVTLAAQHGLIVPLIAVHLFVFYFGLISGTTPPVAVDAFAAAAVAGSDPLKTCIQAFYYSMRTAILPFIFLFNTQLLLIGIGSPWEFVTIVTVSIIAMLVFAAATLGYFLTNSRLWESAALLLVAFTLLRPGHWLDQLQEPYIIVQPAQVTERIERMPTGAGVRMVVEGTTFSGRDVTKTILLPVGERGPSGADRLADAAGLTLTIEDGEARVTNVAFNSPAYDGGIDFGWTVKEVQIEAERPSKHWFYIPGLLLLAAVCALQLRRRRQASAGTTAAASVD
jgi:TRAP transporter 4TM/12TM fusion protein